MAKVEKTTERRVHERHQLHAGAFTTLSSLPRVAGQILNVSEGGLCFRYVASDNSLADPTHLNISLDNGGFSLRNVCAKPVWEAVSDDFSLGLISMRRCAVRFKDLTDEQRADLRIFLQIQTTSPAESK